MSDRRCERVAREGELFRVRASFSEYVQPFLEDVKMRVGTDELGKMRLVQMVW